MLQNKVFKWDRHWAIRTTTKTTYFRGVQGRIRDQIFNVLRRKTSLAGKRRQSVKSIVIGNHRFRNCMNDRRRTIAVRNHHGNAHLFFTSSRLSKSSYHAIKNLILYTVSHKERAQRTSRRVVNACVFPLFVYLFGVLRTTARNNVAYGPNYPTVQNAPCH